MANAHGASRNLRPHQARIKWRLLFREDSLQKRALQVLRLKPNATRSEIKKSFWKLALRHHPDRTKEGLAGDKIMQLLVQAYELLTETYVDPSKYKLLEDDELILSILPKGTRIEPLRPTYEEWHKKHFYGHGAL